MNDNYWVNSSKVFKRVAETSELGEEVKYH
jgi:hypothetical protein